MQLPEDLITCVLVPRENTSLNSCTIGYSLIWINATRRLFAIEELFNKLLYFGDASRATDKNNLINIRLLQVRVFQNFLNRLHCRTEQVLERQEFGQ